MKYLKIHDDPEIFKFDVNCKTISDCVVSDCLVTTHLSQFRRMYADQGNVFWVRYLFSLREFFFHHVFDYLVESLLPNHKSCVYYCMIAIENASIQIHKRFVEGKYKHAKEMIMDIYKFNQFAAEHDNYSLLSLCHIKCHRKNYLLFGSLENLIEGGEAMILFTLIFYNGFYGSLYALLEQFSNASDLPPDFNDNYPTKKYWMPDIYWVEGAPQNIKFSIYVAKYWDYKLCKILQVHDIHKVFLSMPLHPHFCSLEGEFNMENFSLPTSLKYRQCEIHESCRNKILHDRDCKNPYLCDNENSCKVICEVESEERQAKLMNDHSNFWKTFEAESFPCDRSNYCDASTTAETYDDLIQTYAREHISDDDSPASRPPHLDAEFRKFYKKFRKKRERVLAKGQTVFIDKIEKKPSPIASLIRNFNVFDKLNTSIYKNFNFRRMLYKKALKRFTLESVCPIIEKKTFIAQLSQLKFLEDNIFWDKDGDDISAVCNAPGRRDVGTFYDNSIHSMIFSNKIHLKIASSTKGCHTKDELESIEKFFMLAYGGREFKRMTRKQSKKIFGSNLHVHEVGKVCMEELIRKKEKKKLRNHDRSQDAPSSKDYPLMHESKDDLGENGAVSKIVPPYKRELVSDTNDDMENLKVRREDISNQSYSIPPAECSTVSQKLDAIENGVKEKGSVGYEELMLMMQAGNQLVGAIPSPVQEIIQNVDAEDPKNRHIKQRQCAFCNKVEGLKKFKKCAQCKTENYPVPRYYCSRECQIEDWKEFHRDEHQRNTMKN